MRMVPIICRASVGVVGNGEHNLINVEKQDVSVTWVSARQSAVLL